MLRERMKKEEVEDCARLMAEEAVVYGKIGVQLKNFWVSKILDHIALREGKQEHLPEEDRIYFNTWQHMKIMDEIPNLNMTNGIAALLVFITKADNSRVDKVAEKTNQPEFQIDYAGMWDKSSAKDKLTFFKRNDESKCPSGTKWIARDYFKKLGLEVADLMEY